MKDGQEMILQFNSDRLKEISVTHGYNITNSFPVHFHISYNLGIIEQGKRLFTYRGITQRLQAGDLFIIQPFEPHSCRSEQGCYHSYKIISFPLPESAYFPQLLLPTSTLRNTLLRFHTLIEYENNSPELVTLLQEIVTSLLHYSLETKQKASDAQPDISRLKRAKQYIEQHCEQELALTEIAAIACLSEYHFNRVFHRAYGLSPYAYYLICKIKKAQSILLAEKSVINTTYETGFFDQSHFTRLFKKHVGVTPGRYLKDNV